MNDVNINVFICVKVLVMIYAVVVCINGELQQYEHEMKEGSDGSLSVLVVGDWGRKGTHNQSGVAFQMGKIGEAMDIDFVISTGDNFYDNGLTDVDDPAFDASFSKIYTSPSLQKQWYNVLGNHDYEGNALAQLSPVLTTRDRRWFCQRSYILNTDVAEFFFIDTTPLDNKYFKYPKDHTYDWRGVLPRKHYLSNLLKDLEIALRESRAKWKIAVGHHTIRSAGQHGDNKQLVSQLLPILQENDVDLYINGHDHCLQHISSHDSPLQFLTSGGGSKAWRGVVSWWDPKQIHFYYDGQGFMSMKITPHEVNIKFFDMFGNVLHQWTTSKNLNSFL